MENKDNKLPEANLNVFMPVSKIIYNCTNRIGIHKNNKKMQCQ